MPARPEYSASGRRQPEIHKRSPRAPEGHQNPTRRTQGLRAQSEDSRRTAGHQEDRRKDTGFASAASEENPNSKLFGEQKAELDLPSGSFHSQSFANGHWCSTSHRLKALTAVGVRVGMGRKRGQTRERCMNRITGIYKNAQISHCFPCVSRVARSQHKPQRLAH